jgi:hypothetical protein
MNVVEVRFLDWNEILSKLGAVTQQSFAGEKDESQQRQPK